MTRMAGRMVVRPAAAAAALLGGLVLRQLPESPISAHAIWTAGLWLTGLPLLFRTGIGVFRGRLAADLVAALAIVGAMALDQPFAGLVIVLMQTGGEALEHYAERRASAAVRKLEEDAPHRANRIAGDRIEEVEATRIEVGDLVLVRPGEMAPCDGVVEAGTSQINVARLTGEPLPKQAGPGSELRSGTIVLDGPLRIRVTARAEASLYARIVELVRTAQASKAPLQRIADRYAIWFTPVVVLVALGALAISGDPVRMLAVLVVATPCPLILATPVAIIGGINRAARDQIIMRHGGALEALAAVDTAVFDKTGTLTVGRPEVAEVRALPPFTERQVLRLAGAVEQGSGHLLARTLVEAAHGRGLQLPTATDVSEASGRGAWGTVEGHRVTVGAFSLVRERDPAAASVLDELHQDGAALRAFVTVDGQPAGSITYADRLRPGAADVISELRRLGISKIVLLSGDHADNVAKVARAVGIQEVHGDLLPEDKVSYARELAAASRKVLMVGDGINDAPALSTASVGIALAAHGGGIAAEAADVVLLVDNLDRLPEAVGIGRRTMRVARQSIGFGLGLSAAAMVAAAFGYLVPAVGALVQEVIDVAVILNALRATRG
ncbi:MAG TPA: heavy metal translocating P-type ATPase [Gemmatimonadales bacterium]|nr:heavy metal translocating P-type ATPase [Gemmatimonadales bacterium]